MHLRSRPLLWLSLGVALGLLLSDPAPDASIQDQPPPKPETFLPRDTARMYPRPKAEIWRTVLVWLKAQKIATDKVDQDLQLVVTKPIVVTRKTFGFDAIAIDPSLVFAQTRVYIFVSPFIEPARVYVASTADGRVTDEPREDPLSFNRLSYYQPVIGEWVLKQISAQVGTEGEAIPTAWAPRRALARTLAPNPGDPCLSEEFAAMVRGKRWRPEDLVDPKKRFELQPVYPTDLIAQRRTGLLELDAVVNEDGLTRVNRVMPGDPLPSAFVTAARGAVSFWRYQPAIIGACPIECGLTIYVNFKLRTGTSAHGPS
jgi:hypothetical protein